MSDAPEVKVDKRGTKWKLNRVGGSIQCPADCPALALKMCTAMQRDGGVFAPNYSATITGNGIRPQLNVDGTRIQLVKSAGDLPQYSHLKSSTGVCVEVCSCSVQE